MAPLIWLAVLATAPVAHETVIAAPIVQVVPSGETEIDAALARTVSLPLLVSRGQFGADQSDGQPALLREQARLTALVRSFGYLEGHVDIVADAPWSTGVPPSTIKVRPVLGPLFRIGTVQVTGIHGADTTALVAGIHARIATVVGKPARADLLAALSDEIRWQVRSASYPFAHVAETGVSTDSSLELASIVIGLDIGAPARFGPVHFSGGRGLDRQALRDTVPFSVGDAFDPVQLDALVEATRSIHRVRNVRVNLSEPADEDGLVSVEVRIQVASDPGVLAQGWLHGVLVLGAAVTALAARQLLVAGGMRGHAPLILAVNSLIGALVAYGAVLVLLRAIAFAQFG